MTLLARLISKREGYGIPGAVPTRDNNPGDLRHSPHSSHQGEGPNDIGEIDTPADGWLDLERQLQLFASRGLTLQQMIEEKYAPPTENDSAAYLAFVVQGGGWTNDTLVAEALQVP
jgi:hypothetical protein